MAEAVDVTFADWNTPDKPWHGSYPSKPGEYVVHASQGQGDCECGSYPDLESALIDVRAHLGEMSYGIKYPNGKWHEWSKEDNDKALTAFVKAQGWRAIDEH